MKDGRDIVVATWSGGIDSTGVIANLLAHEYHVVAVSLKFGPPLFQARERQARESLRPFLTDLPGKLTPMMYDAASWLYAFSADGEEIPYRNKRIIDHLVAAVCPQWDTKNLGMGEYIGCDTWVVRDHVGAADCDARSLTAYVFNEYGLDWRLFTLADFGESRYKADRLKLLVDVIGPEGAARTTNCLNSSVIHCGSCYKCLERRAAFDTLGLRDETEYGRDPSGHPHFETYVRQMQGEDVTVAHAEIG